MNQPESTPVLPLRILIAAEGIEGATTDLLLPWEKDSLNKAILLKHAYRGIMFLFTGVMVSMRCPWVFQHGNFF
ncbi:MAG: hypothetical protein JXB88_10870 [Spirochaetales bacterium]|nr:hypothetical protein [Spirochaetales bacterium]